MPSMIAPNRQLPKIEAALERVLTLVLGVDVDADTTVSTVDWASRWTSMESSQSPVGLG